MAEISKDKFVYRCETCQHDSYDTANDVSACNVCGMEIEPNKILDCYDIKDKEN